MNNYKILYKLETGYDAITSTNFRSGENFEYYTDEYVIWLENKLNLEHHLKENDGWIDINLFEPKNNELIIIEDNSVATYICDNEVLTYSGDIEKITKYKTT